MADQVSDVTSPNVTTQVPSSTATHTLATSSLPTYLGTPVLSAVKLTEKTYVPWSHAVHVWFRGEGLTMFLTDPPPGDSTSAEFQRWDRIDAKLLSYLWHSIDPTCYHYFQTCRSARSVWTLAKSLFSGEVTRIYDVVSTMANIQLDDTGIPGLSARIRNLMEEFDLIFPMSTDLQTQAHQREQMFLVIFLRALPPSFEPIRAQLLGGSSLPSINEACSRLIRGAPVSVETSPASVAMPAVSPVASRQPIAPAPAPFGTASRAKGTSRGRPRDRCTYCKRWGHTVDRCYTLHGRPALPPAQPHGLSAVTSFDSSLVPHPSAAALSASSSGVPGSSLPPGAPRWTIDSGATTSMSGSGDRQGDWYGI